MHRATDERLTWVVLNGEVRRVSDFAHLPPAKRPEVRCPECEQRVILKLGNILVHHVQHEREDDPCAANHPETALHINVKCHIAAQLSEAMNVGVSIRIAAPCVAGRERSAPISAGMQVGYRHDAIIPSLSSRGECLARREFEWPLSWDEVRLERRVEHPEVRRIPDILLRLEGRDIAAVEVFCTHAVDSEKEKELAEIGVPWIEVRGDAIELRGEDAWAYRAPLPVHRVVPSVTWRCEHHEREEKRRLADMERQRRAQAAEREAARHTTHVRAVRVVDIYYLDTGGTRFRVIYRVEEKATDGVVHTVLLQRGDVTLLRIPITATWDASSRKDAWRRIRTAFASDRATYEKSTKGGGAMTDSPMDWARGALADKVTDAMSFDVDNKGYPLFSRYPRRFFFNPQTNVWFKTKARNVTWNRPMDDPLDAHPASASRHHTSGKPRLTRTGGSPGIDWSDGPQVAPATTSATPQNHLNHAPVYSVPLAARVYPDDFGTAWECEELETVSIVTLSPVADLSPRIVLLLKHKMDLAAIREIDAALRQDDVPHVWVAHRYDWTKHLRDLPWLPSARAPSGEGMVIIDGECIPAAEFAREFSSGALRFRPERIALSAERQAARLPF